MINKKVGLSILSGKRNKQQILKEFARPSNENTSISSPTISTGTYGGNIPGCSGGISPAPVTPCGDADSDLSDISFERNAYTAIKVGSKSWSVKQYPYPGGTITSTTVTSAFTLNPTVIWDDSPAPMEKTVRYMAYRTTNLGDMADAVSARTVPGLSIQSYVDAPDIQVELVQTTWGSGGPGSVNYIGADEEVVWSGIIPAYTTGPAPSIPVEATFDLLTPGECYLHIRATTGDLASPGPSYHIWAISLLNLMPIEFLGPIPSGGVAGGGGLSNTLQWHTSFPGVVGYYNWAVTRQAGVLPGGTLATTGTNGKYGSRIYSRWDWEDVAEPITALFKFHFNVLGDVAENSTQHALEFSLRGYDTRSGTATAGGFTGPTTDVADDAQPFSARIVWLEYPARLLPSSYLDVPGAGQVEIDPPIAINENYFLLIEAEVHSIQATFWREDDPDTKFTIVGTETATMPPNISIRNLENFDNPPVDMESSVTISRVIINPTSTVIGGGECGGASDSAGSYMETLYVKYNYFRPQATDLSYYAQVYFDGVPVTKGTHYNIEDTYKIVPVDPEALSSEATALIVRQ